MIYNACQRPKISIKLVSVVSDDQRGFCGGIEGNRGVSRHEFTKSLEKARKQTGNKRKRQNKYEKIYQPKFTN